MPQKTLCRLRFSAHHSVRSLPYYRSCTVLHPPLLFYLPLCACATLLLARAKVRRNAKRNSQLPISLLPPHAPLHTFSVCVCVCMCVAVVAAVAPRVYCEASRHLASACPHFTPPRFARQGTLPFGLLKAVVVASLTLARRHKSVLAVLRLRTPPPCFSASRPSTATSTAQAASARRTLRWQLTSQRRHSPTRQKRWIKAPSLASRRSVPCPTSHHRHAATSNAWGAVLSGPGLDGKSRRRSTRRRLRRVPRHRLHGRARAVRRRSLLGKHLKRLCSPPSCPRPPWKEPPPPRRRPWLAWHRRCW